jgi:small subunit ribosomal protein S21
MEEREEAREGGRSSMPVLGRPIEVKVDERGIERALRRLRRVMATEGVLREIKRRRHYEKPSVRRNRKVREAVRRRKRKG